MALVSQGLHVYKPLLPKQRLDNRAALVAVPYAVAVSFFFFEYAQLLQVINH